MPEHEARVRAFYDHEAEESGAGRRRRPVADWGVGEDVFDRLPSRRFSRAEASHARRAADAPHRPAEESAVEAHSAPSTDRPQGHPAGSPADRPQGHPAGSPAERPERPPAATAAEGVATAPGRRDDGRRTIVIGARAAQPAARRRPPRSAVERVGPRPDRIVAYAVALGILLILIAVLSAGH